MSRAQRFAGSTFHKRCSPKRKVPKGTFLEADLLNDWPPLPKFGRVVSAYVLREFDLSAKLEILVKSAERLEEGGPIIVADIAFPNREVFEQAHNYWREAWDESEHYRVADEALRACQEVGLKGKYEQVSSCAGVFVFQLF